MKNKSKYQAMTDKPLELSFGLGFEFALDLTAQSDYLSLTAKLLEQLHAIPTLWFARMFEVHTADRNKEFQGVSTENLLVREVMNDMEEPKPFNDIAALNRSIQAREAITASSNNQSNQQIVLPIPGSNGQMRVLLIGATQIEPRYWELIHNLIQLYENQLLIFDEKERDKLTGLYNRQTFDEKLTRVMSYYRTESQKARDATEGSWLAVLDIDRFKAVNDSFGHMIGDEVLLLFSRLMERSFRHSDMLFRYGGEEYVVILNSTDREGAEVALERFRLLVANYEFPQVGRVTVSIGYIFLNDQLLPSTLIDQADKALYFAKEHGRNQVIYYGSLDKEAIDHPGEQEGDIELF